MLIVAALVIMVNTTLGLLSPLLARGLTPWTAARLISCVAFVTTVASGFVIAVVSFGFVAQLAPVAALGSWSVTSLQNADRISALVGTVALLVAIVAFTTALRRTGAVVRELTNASRMCRSLAGSRQEPIVQLNEHPDAFALFGPRGGRIVVTSAMLEAVDGQELGVIVAHEESHLRHRHHLYLALATVAAAANPAIRAVPRVVSLAIERWADEDAAASIGDRRLAARAVTRAGLATLRSGGSPRPAASLAAASSAVRQRASALLQPRPRTNMAPVAVIAAAALLSGIGTLNCERQTEHRFEQAHAGLTAGAATAMPPLNTFRARGVAD